MMTGDDLLAQAQAAFAWRYPFAWPVRVYVDRNMNLDCECAAAGDVVYIEFTFGQGGRLSPNYATSLYCAGCGETWHPAWKRELWERLTNHGSLEPKQ